MMDIFDADCGCLGIGAKEKLPVAAGDLSRMLDRLRIARALVRYAPVELSASFPRRNDALFALAADEPRVRPCPAVAPSAGFGEPDESEQVDVLIRRGARCVTVCPATDCWLVEPFVCDRLFAALQERRLPVVAPVTAVPLAQVGALAGRFPQLPLVVTGLGYRSARDLRGLLDAFGNVHLSLGHNVSTQGVIERMVGRYGAGRFVLGTGFPEVDPCGAVTQLAYARIGEDDKQAIGHGTLDRLTGEVGA